jgi:hypothetical protein
MSYIYQKDCVKKRLKMGLFNKKENMKEVRSNVPSVPELPELPKLPDFPYMDESSNEVESLPQLPRFPNNSLGNKFSQNTIKEAISGKKEEEEVFDAEDFSGERMGMMQKPLQRSVTDDSEEYETGVLMKPKLREISQSFVERNYMTKKAEPIFIRIDKFEESMNIFHDIKTQISEIESLIRTTKEIKAKEEEELVSWQNEIQAIKDQIEKVNQDIFSRIE